MLPTINRTQRSLALFVSRVHYVLIFIFSCVPNVAGAADPNNSASTEQVTLARALSIVCEEHPEIGVPKAAVAEATAAVARARAARYPQGEANLMFGIVNGAATGDVPDELPDELAPLFAEGGPNDPLNNLGPFIRGTIRLTQPIFTFGKITQGVEAAKAGVGARRAYLKKVCVDLRLQLRQLHYGYQLAADLYRSLQKVANAFTEAEKLADARLTSGDGDITQIEVLKLKIAAHSLRQRLIQLNSKKNTALFAWRRALGWSIDALIFPASDRLRAVEAIAYSPSEDENTESQPAWQALSAGLQARQARASAASRRLYPNLFLGIFVDASWAPTRDDIRNPFLRDEFNRIRGGPILGLQWDLNFAQHLANKAQAEAQVASHIAKVEQARVGLPLQLRAAYTTYQEKKATLALSQTNRKTGRSLSFLAATNFRLGLGQPKEVLESLGLYAKVLGEYFETIYEYNMAAGTLVELTQGI
ncbi:MAG: TolC family protein [Myxococcales bacterium]|nr:TolC family protein [Myxococcales bacterium]